MFGCSDSRGEGGPPVAADTDLAAAGLRHLAEPSYAVARGRASAAAGCLGACLGLSRRLFGAAGGRVRIAPDTAGLGPDPSRFGLDGQVPASRTIVPRAPVLSRSRLVAAHGACAKTDRLRSRSRRRFVETAFPARRPARNQPPARTRRPGTCPLSGAGDATPRAPRARQRRAAASSPGGNGSLCPAPAPTAAGASRPPTARYQQGYQRLYRQFLNRDARPKPTRLADQHETRRDSSALRSPPPSTPRP